MAKLRSQKLKVFRTPIGFHDAYVAAPSMKAALEAWGAEGNLFAQGIAEAVSDPKLMKAPLDRPGEVIRVARGTNGEHLKAAENSLSSAGKRAGTRTGSGVVKKQKPSRAALDAAEETLAAAEQRHRDELRELAREQSMLDRRRREAERRYAVERDEAAAELDKAKRAFDRAMADWKA